MNRPSLRLLRPILLNLLTCAVISVSGSHVAVAQPIFDDGSEGSFYQPGPRFGDYRNTEDQIPLSRQIVPLTLSHYAGEGIGYTNSFTSLNAFIPLSNEDDNTMWFGDFRGFVHNDWEFGGNIGTGYRWYNTDQNRIYGVNGYWDVRHNEAHLFNQIGLGVESLGEVVDWRLNGYTPAVNDTNQQLPSQFSGNNLLRRTLSALSGLDFEIGANLPQFSNFHSRVFAGGYYFDSGSTDEALGYRVRGEFAFRDSVTANVAYQKDDLFGSMLVVGAELRTLLRLDPPSRPMDHKFRRRQNGAGWGDTVHHRLGDPVRRLQNIVLTETIVPFTDAGGVPLTFVHVVEGAAGVGTFEDPYGTISAAMLDPLAPTSVVYTPEGGTFTENVTMVAGTRLLSNGPAQFVETGGAPVQLPGSGVSSDLTMLPASIVGNVTLADDVELSGFDITGAVSGAGIMNPNLNHLRVQMSGSDGIALTGTSASMMTDILVTDSVGRGILLDDSSSILNRVTIDGAGGVGLEVSTAATDRIVTADMLTVTGPGAEGAALIVGGAGSLDATFSNADITAVTTGLAAETIGGSAGDLNLIVTDSMVTSSAANAVDLMLGGAGEFNATISGTTLSSLATGIAAGTAAGSTGDMNLALSSDSASSTGGTGFDIDGTAGGGVLFVSQFENMTVPTAAAGGAIFNDVSFDADPSTVAIDAVLAQALTIGIAGGGGGGGGAMPITGDGLSLTDAIGELRFSSLVIVNDTGTGLFADSSGAATPLNLTSGPGSSVTTTNGAALTLDTIAAGTLDPGLVFNSITSSDSPGRGIDLTTVSGFITSGTTTISGAVPPSIRYSNIVAASPLTADFGTTTINSTVDNTEATNINLIGDTTGLTTIYTPLIINGP